MKDRHIINALIRTAMGQLAKTERMMKNNPPNKSITQISIHEGSEELFTETVKVLEATTEFYNFCKNKAEIDFLKDLKL